MFNQSGAECLKKAYVKLYYIPPTNPEIPVDCKQVKITKPPEIRIFTGQISKLEGIDGNGMPGRGDLIGIEVHCAVASAQGAGALNLLLQVGSYIEWEIEFIANVNRVTSVVRNPCPAPWEPKPKIYVPEELDYHPVMTPVKTTVRETHRVYISMPMKYKIPMARMALMARTPWKFKLPAYAAQIWNAFKKLEEVEKVVAPISELKKGFCPEDIRAMEDGLKKLETELNLLLKRAVNQVGGDIASTMRGVLDNTGRFAGTRFA